MSSISTFALAAASTEIPRLASSTLNLVTTPTASQMLINTTVTIGETWLIKKLLVVCRAYGKFDILVNGVVVGSGRTSPVESNVNVIPEPFVKALTGEAIVINYIETVGPVVDIEAYVYATKV